MSNINPFIAIEPDGSRWVSEEDYLKLKTTIDEIVTEIYHPDYKIDEKIIQNGLEKLYDTVMEA